MSMNEVLDIDGNMFCIMPYDGCLGDPRTPVSFGRTIKDVVANYRYDLRPHVVGRLPEDLMPESRDGFSGITCAETNIAYVGYKYHMQIMRVEYTNGNRYDYFDVPREDWQKVLASDSKGAMLNRIIKGNYRYCRREGDE